MPESDVLVVGAGVAGCAFALRAASMGHQVTILTNARETKRGSNTSWAQGGIIYQGEGDDPELLVEDIQRAGCHICDADAVHLLATRGPELVKSLLIDQCAIHFDVAPGGSLDLTEEAAHSIPRIIHVGDHTGMAIAEALEREVHSAENIRVVTKVTAVDLIMAGYHTDDPREVYQPARCLGVYVLDHQTGQVEPYVARETVLATGGLGQVFLHTTNPRRSRGDGLAMAYRAGVRLICLEYIQFHPTAFYHRVAPRILLSESMRGEGAELVNSEGERFMYRYDERGPLAPRDVVSRASHEEMLRSGEVCMYLDITHKDPAWVRNRFPLIAGMLREWGVDIATERIPVVPAAHYSCGGIAVDLWGRTNIGSLRAIGEVSCTGVHGANRLASTSLLEGLVWGVQAAEGFSEDLKRNPPPRQRHVMPWRLEHEEIDPALITQDWMTIKQTMWNYVGLVRTTRRMNRALKILRGLQFDLENFYRQAALTDDLIGLRSGAQAALAVTLAALRNRTSRGSHYRVDPGASIVPSHPQPRQ